MVCDARKLHTTSHVTSTWFEHRHCAITHLRIRFFRSPNVLRFLFHISSSFSAGKTRARLGIFRGRKEERKTRWKRREGGKEPLIRGFARWWAFLLLLFCSLPPMAAAAAAAKFLPSLFEAEVSGFSGEKFAKFST